MVDPNSKLQIIFYRVQSALLTFPSRNDWFYAAKLLGFFAVVYLPIGFRLGFLAIDIRSDWRTIIGVVTGAFVMPALLEELGFRVLLIPHPTESISSRKRQLQIALSSVLFVFYHLHPFVPAFFKTPAFLIGVILISAICTLSYLRSGSIWIPVILHWVIVVAWLLAFGGLRRFQG